MNHSLQKTLIYAGLIFSGGFTVLNLVNKDASWRLWLFAFLVVLCFYYVLIRPKNREEKNQEVYTILPDSARKALNENQMPHIGAPQLRLQNGEHLYWVDQMRTNYYNSKPHVFYLTNKRLVCLDENFRFAHPLQDLKVTFKPQSNQLTIKIKKAELSFLCASSNEMKLAFYMIQNHSSKQDNNKGE